LGENLAVEINRATYQIQYIFTNAGTSAIVASSLLDELHWSESQVGQVQSAFFVGYALTQVFGGLLGGYQNENEQEEEGQRQQQQEGYRTIVPISLVLTGITTLLFPVAAQIDGSGVNNGPTFAILDRFVLGLLEGLLLPAAMSGVSATTTSIASTVKTMETSDSTGNFRNNNNNKATASSIVIAGCYLGSAWAYLSAWILFSEVSQVLLHQLDVLPLQHGHDHISVWPMLFYINGILSLLITVMFSSEFHLYGSLDDNNTIGTKLNDKTSTFLASFSRTSISVMKDTIAIAKETLSSKSGRAIIAAQVGQGALLYSIASWGPLYLERVADVSNAVGAEDVVLQSSSSSTFISSTALAASVAASSLVLPQLTQALIGVSIGVGADKISSNMGPRLTRRLLQFISGVGPAIILFYLSLAGNSSTATSLDFGAFSQSPALLFGIAQTISAISLGAVSVSHLEVASPSKSGAVYALGNVFAAISGSITVTLFGYLLDKNIHQAVVTNTDSVSAGVSDFALPFQIVALLSAAGSIFYSLTIESELEIGVGVPSK
jgi:hypothetical protein